MHSDCAIFHLVAFQSKQQVEYQYSVEIVEKNYVEIILAGKSYSYNIEGVFGSTSKLVTLSVWLLISSICACHIECLVWSIKHRLIKKTNSIDGGNFARQIY